VKIRFIGAEKRHVARRSITRDCVGLAAILPVLQFSKTTNKKKKKEKDVARSRKYFLKQRSY
jgi:hypothetical protein